ncbi:MAG: hypothetical protein AMXMBFR82_39620 [Candidatus Hydrogenedentota bacterium]
MLLLLFAWAAAASSALTNPDFDDGLEGWTPSSVEIEMLVTSVDDRSIARIVVPETAQPGYPHVAQSLDALPGDLISATAEARNIGVQRGAGAYMVIEYFDAAEKRVSFSQSNMAETDGSWTELRVQGVMPKEAVRARIALILNGTGTAEFDAVTATREPGVGATGPPDGPVTITITDNVVCDSFRGFGVEDDGWFYNPENAAHGVTEDDARLREERIASMGIDWVRMFFWYKDWNPSGDWETFSFDSPNMESHYRTLDLYQRLGVPVNVVGVEWGVEDPYGNPEAAAKAIGALFEHLIKTKGYTCVQEWTLTNEPNGYFIRAGYDFERFVQLHELVHAEFERRGLTIRIVGSDETNGGYSFFKQCVTDDRYYPLVDYFASHRYFPYADRVTAPAFYNERLEVLAAKTRHKDLVIAEFGFQDDRSGALVNPLMETYPYAVWTAAFVIDGLNRGVAGFSIWCLQEMYYPGNGFMNYGLWDFKDNNWKPRPVYHAWRNFTTLTQSGDAVRACASSSPAHVVAAVMGGVLFWANHSDYAADVRVEGWEDALSLERRENPTSGAGLVVHKVLTESTLPESSDRGTLELTNRTSFSAPPMSFGYIRGAGATQGRAEGD